MAVMPDGYGNVYVVSEHASFANGHTSSQFLPDSMIFNHFSSVYTRLWAGGQVTIPTIAETGDNSQQT